MKIGATPNVDLPPKQVLIVGTGRCGTKHVHKMFNLIFSEYIWSSHEHAPTSTQEVADIYEKQDFTSKRVLGLARRKWRILMGQRAYMEDAPIHRWSDSSTFNVPLLYHFLGIWPETKVVVMIRHPEGFYRSCNALRYNEPLSKGQKVGFIWDRMDHPRWKENYHQYWLECYANIRLQLRWLHHEPDLVMFLGPYGEGRYIRQLLRLVDIPETQQNIENAKWFCSRRASNFTSNRDAWRSTEIPDLEMCKPEWDWWEENYAWMAKEE